MKNLQGEWPLLVIMIMFFILPMSTIPGLFDFIFAILGLIALLIIGLIVASIITARRHPRNEQ
ncbi:MAG: hypothetical protein ACUVR3_09575 [Candidatus Roseilinea sp.]|uniref:hypothetical protein n=1 Tax=Candidatus Roseilinea sp. TaxID=2838777 RepID=UPI0040499317